MGRPKIKFNDEVIKFIVDCYYQHVNKVDICRMIQERFGFHVCSVVLYQKFKELGLNGDRKIRTR